MFFKNELTSDLKTRQNKNNLMDMFDKEYLPHMGLRKEDRISKLKYTGMLIRKLILIKLEIL